jgi:hypothetical protein
MSRGNGGTKGVTHTRNVVTEGEGSGTEEPH